MKNSPLVLTVKMNEVSINRAYLADLADEYLGRVTITIGDETFETIDIEFQSTDNLKDMMNALSSFRKPKNTNSQPK